MQPAVSRQPGYRWGTRGASYDISLLIVCVRVCVCVCVCVYVWCVYVFQQTSKSKYIVSYATNFLAAQHCVNIQTVKYLSKPQDKANLDRYLFEKDVGAIRQNYRNNICIKYDYNIAAL